MLTVLFAFLSIGILGALFGLGLAWAARVFAVKKDDRVIQAEAMLPGANCGACGFAGCAAYADAIVNQGAELNRCTPGGSEVAAKLGEFMGVAVDFSGEKQVAQVYCRGTRKTSTVAFEYRGLEDCNALYASFKGDKDCPYGCLGQGSCIRVCPADAIKRHPDGYIFVEKEKCISCGLCISVCPTGVIKWTPYSADVLVACNSTDKGPAVKKYCSVGCIGCGICAKKSPEGGFVVENFLARIDYSQPGSRKEAAAACPVKCIIPLDEKSPAKEESREEEKVSLEKT